MSGLARQPNPPMQSGFQFGEALEGYLLVRAKSDLWVVGELEPETVEVYNEGIPIDEYIRWDDRSNILNIQARLRVRSDRQGGLAVANNLSAITDWIEKRR